MIRIRNLQKLSMLGCAVALAAGGSSVHAALLAYDPFAYGDPANPAAGEYAVGDEGLGVNVLGGQNPIIGPTAFYAGGWIQSGGDAQVVMAQPSLSYASLQAGVGGVVGDTVQFACCSFGRSGREIAGGLGSGLGSRTVYESFLVDFGSQGTDDPTQFGKRGHELWNGGVGDSFLAVDLFMNSFSGVNDLTLNVTTPGSGTVSDVVGSGLNLSELDGVHLVVMKYEFNSAAPDSVSVFLDPVVGLPEPLIPDAEVSIATSDLFITHHGTLASFTFSGPGHEPGAFDELRWGDTFLDVTPLSARDVPEATPGAVLALSLAGLALFRARRYFLR
jgi:hypothetical protein